jgi:hypothetical protein
MLELPPQRSDFPLLLLVDLPVLCLAAVLSG